MTSTDPKTLSISVIIPTYNEGGNLPVLLEDLRAYPDLEIIVTDGGSRDQTPTVAREFGVRFVSSEKGRCFQLNTGAQAATGEVLLFLHCDTFLPENFSEHLHEVLGRRGTSVGAFRLKIDAPGAGFRLIEWGANLRSRWWRLPYGDQALFVRRDIFARAGGFPDFPIMEDIGLVRRLKKLGRVRIAATPVTTSARRWQKFGLVRTTLMNQILLCGLFVKADLGRLRRLYDRGTDAGITKAQS